MKRKEFVQLVIAFLCSFSMLLAPENHLIDATIDKNSITSAKVNLNPASQQKNVDDGRSLGDILMTIDLTSIGMPGDGFDNAGLSWDGTYLYLINRYDINCYIIDPTGPTIITNYTTPASDAWGLGMEDNLWVSDISTDSCYEFGTGASFHYLQGWIADISEWWAQGELWLLSVGGTNKIYKYSIPDGTLLDSLGDVSWTSTSQRGLTYDPHNHKFWLGGWNSNIVWEIDPDTGTPTRQFSFNNVSGIAYDWQSNLYPDPVLWIATNEATNYIYMVDVDNPQVGIEKTEQNNLTFFLSQNEPNPVKSRRTTINYSIPINSHVSLTIYNAAGQHIKTLVNKREKAGKHLIKWDCTNNNNNPVTSGIYFYRLTSQNASLLKKMVVLR